MEEINGIVETIYDDFDTIESVIKEKAVAFLLSTDKNGKIIVVYDKNALELGLIKVGELLSCLGTYEGVITVKDSTGKINEDKMFLSIAIMGNADIDEEKLSKQGARRLI